MFGNGSGKRRGSNEGVNTGQAGQAGVSQNDGMRVPDLLARRRSSVHPIAINVQAASSAVAGPDGGPSPSTPSFANPLTQRRASLAPQPPQQDYHLSSGPDPSQARRSSVILGRVGDGGSGRLTERRGSALGAGLLGAARELILPFRPPAHSTLRLDPSAAGRHPPSKEISPLDPLMRMDKNDLRRPSFAQTMAATGEGLVRTRPPRSLRRKLLRLAVGISLLYLVVKLLASIMPSSYEEEEDTYPHIPLPPSFTSLMQRQPSPSNRPTTPRPMAPREPLLHGDEMRAFRREKLWGPPDDPIETVVIKPAEGHGHESTVIFLHGLLQYAGDSPLAQFLPGRFPNTRWVMPQAQKKPVTVQDGKMVPAWFDMLGFPYDNSVDEDPPNLYASARLINAIITNERDDLIRALRERGGFGALPEGLRPVRREGDEVEGPGQFGTRVEKEWASSRMILSGFSQGSVITLLTGLTTEHRLGGLILLSSFMPLRRTLGSLVEDLNRTDLPIFWGHGDDDEYLTLPDAAHSVELLRSSKPDNKGQGGLALTVVEYHVYPGMGHTFCGDEMDHIEGFIRRTVPR